jgi:hypothetical protein
MRIDGRRLGGRLAQLGNSAERTCARGIHEDVSHLDDPFRGYSSGGSIVSSRECKVYGVIPDALLVENADAAIRQVLR